MIQSDARQAVKFVFSNVRVHPGQNFIEFARGQITFHLFIPRGIGPRMKAGRDFCPFLQAEVLHRFLIF